MFVCAFVFSWPSVRATGGTHAWIELGGWGWGWGLDPSVLIIPFYLCAFWILEMLLQFLLCLWALARPLLAFSGGLQSAALGCPFFVTTMVSRVSGAAGKIILNFKGGWLHS